jgi:hypothetical protein
MAAVPAAYLMYAAIATTALSAGVAAYSSYEAGRREKSARDYNARMAEYQAQTARQAAEARREIYAKKASRQLATMRARYGASGVDVSEGSPLLVLMESAGEAAKDELRIKYGGEAESWSLLSEAQQQREAGEGAYTGGIISAGGSLLSGAAKGFSIYSGYREAKDKGTRGGIA